ncbi:MAG: YggS family pyridoxal phosphate-dependent enzyme [Firmicutes bacterium]|jgi:pyridoxal phosphate enzyme (YggS family)|nr:YggS family pyridoxal phosphate-dependent enzyme [Bacillota bacterium]
MNDGPDIRANLDSVRLRVDRAARRSGRDPSEITLVAVTKTVPVHLIEEAIRLGVTDIGENRVQEARAKFGAIQETVRWHMVGRLQSNKVGHALKIFELIHSLDRLSLASELDRIAGASGRPARVLVQVNVSGEATKSGVSPGETLAFLKEVSAFEHLSVEGLMTIAPLVPAEDTRSCFRALRRIFEEAASAGFPRVRMSYLSMGMTNDFEVAVEEGSNMIRLGTAIFGPRPVP